MGDAWAWAPWERHTFSKWCLFWHFLLVCPYAGQDCMRWLRRLEWPRLPQNEHGLWFIGGDGWFVLGGTLVINNGIIVLNIVPMSLEDILTHLFTVGCTKSHGVFAKIAVILTISTKPRTQMVISWFFNNSTRPIDFHHFAVPTFFLRLQNNTIAKVQMESKVTKGINGC